MTRQLCFCFTVAICAVLSLALFHPVSAQQLGRVLNVNKTDNTCNGRSPGHPKIQAAIEFLFLVTLSGYKLGPIPNS